MLIICVPVNQLDSGVVSRVLHAILYAQLERYQLRKAVALVELVLRIPDVHKAAAIYGTPQQDTITALSIYSKVCHSQWTFLQ